MVEERERGVEEERGKEDEWRGGGVQRGKGQLLVWR